MGPFSKNSRKINPFKQQQILTFNATKAQIDKAGAGEAAFMVMYNGKKSDTLDSLRYKKYCDKVATSLT